MNEKMENKNIYEKQWNPLYLEYCRYNGGITPDEMLNRDRGQMHEYIIWNRKKWREFFAIYPQYKCCDGPSEEGIKKFVEWLKNQ